MPHNGGRNGGVSDSGSSDTRIGSPPRTQLDVPNNSSL